ncbi:MAG: pro-sigmaK processing inhibitor BofA family protein [Sulfobacillus sp.]
MLQPKEILAGVFGVLMLYLLGRMVGSPLRWIARNAINVAVAVIVLWAWDRLMGFTGFYIGVNPVTAAVVGLLGVPGFLLVLAARALTLGW